MLLSLIHALAAKPRIYDFIQDIGGARVVRERVCRHFQGSAAGAIVIDLGGGTGAIRSFLPPACQYVCLDPDPLKLSGFQKGGMAGAAVRGSATTIPIRDGAADYVLVFAMCHHLTEEDLDDTFREIRRVLKPNGRLVLLDPVAAPHRLTSRILWRLDRGSYPRHRGRLWLRGSTSHLRIIDQDHFAIF